MKGVQIAELKSKLSQHLRLVREGGTVTVLDRTTPIAKIVPYQGQTPQLQVRKPLPGVPTLRDIRLPPPLRLECDVVELLLDERRSDR